MSHHGLRRGHPLDYASEGNQVIRRVADGEQMIKKFPWVAPPEPPKSRIGYVFDAVERALGGEPR